MNIKNLITMMLVASLFLASCGPKAINDADFVTTAQPVCEKLQTNSAALGVLDLTSRAAAYKVAVDTLAPLHMTETSAPQGTRLRTGLGGLANSFDKLAKAISDATTKANLDAPVTVLIGDDGSMFAYSGDNMFGIQTLEIDPTIMSDVRAYQEQVRNAAGALKLEQCVIDW